MKKIGIICMILLFISSDIPNEEVHELEELAVIMKDADLTIEEWFVTVKEKVSKKQIQQQLLMLEKDYFIEYKENNNVTKYIIDNYLETDDIHVTYEITIPYDDEHSPELVATIKGTDLNMTILKQYKAILKHSRNQFFTEKSSLFTCLITSKNGMIASDDFSKLMSKNLDLKNVSTQTDAINEILYQEIIYGYTTMWNNEVLIENKPLNIQVVIQRLKNEKTKVIIGTPILITEY